jgi:hypothetical protein
MSDPLVEKLDELVDGQAATVGVLDEGLRGLLDVFGGIEAVKGRDGKDGRDGQHGRDGESVVQFRTGYDRLWDSTSDGAAFLVGHAIHGTPEDAPGWWIERWPRTGAPNLLVVELAADVQEGRLRWTDRASYTYRRSEASTVARRKMMARFAVDQPDEFLAQLLDVGVPPAMVDGVRDVITRYPIASFAYLESGGDPIKTARAYAQRMIDERYPQFSPSERERLREKVLEMVAS